MKQNKKHPIITRRNFDFAKLYQEYWNKKILELIPYKKWNYILDVGAGAGIFTKELSKIGNKIIVLEPNFELISEFKKNLNNYTNNNFYPIIATAENLPIKKNKLDLVVAREVLHHLKDENTALKEIYRILIKNGWLMISDPCNNNPILKLLRYYFNNKTKYFEVHHHASTKKRLKKILIKNNFIIKKHFPLGFFSYPLSDLNDILPIMKHIPFNKFFINILIKFDNLLEKIYYFKWWSWLQLISCQKKEN